MMFLFCCVLVLYILCDELLHRFELDFETLLAPLWSPFGSLFLAVDIRSIRHVWGFDEVAAGGGWLFRNEIFLSTKSYFRSK